MHRALIDAMRSQPAFAELRHCLPAPGNTCTLTGLAGSAPSLMIAALADAMPQRIWVVVAHSPGEAEAIEADLHSLYDAERVTLYPQRETLPYEATEHHVEVSGLRVEAIEALLSGRARVLVTTGRALQERAELPSGLAELRTTLRVGDAVRLQELAERLDELGFERTPLVDGVGEYALRGGILDLFGFGAPEPVRIELWGDEIASIRSFDVLDQRSTGTLQQIEVLPVDLRMPAGDPSAGVRRSLLDILPRDAFLVEAAGSSVEDDFSKTWTQVLHLHDASRKRGGDPEAPQLLFLDPGAAVERYSGFGRIRIDGDAPAVRFDVREPESIDRDIETLQSLLRAGAARGEQTHILCDNAGQLERLEELLGGRDSLPPQATLALGAIARGFVLEGAEPPVRVLTDHEIFQRDRRLRRTRRFRGAVALESLSQLNPGDYIVHLDHGIGRFTGLQRVKVGDEEIESLTIEYASGETLRVPVYRLDLIERWVPDREDGAPPKLHKIGGKAWTSLKKKTQQAIQEMAAELLRLYAIRQEAERPPFPPDTRWQKEMESSFLYEDTPDQRDATADVKRDMESRHPMDRLVCGDVGYGKTEIAVRAAFKAAQDGRQVAVLAPTTILVEQHLKTFRERLAGYPIRVEALSRFRTAKEQGVILDAIAQGTVDIAIGTHRLLEPDVRFRDLGMLVVDEEQRFGVKQKERFKEMKHNVDVLSLTATPIPRTLHFSLTGLRDMSLLQTPPRDRMPILTHVLPWVDEVIEDAIHRELDRGGQVFFVHNRVQSLAAVAERVRRIVPDATVDSAHGQMTPHDLDDVMRRFLSGEVRVLVTTAIIENGLDVPTANTLIVDRADLFGLAQLYQLRGRVGRSHHRAYCYLLIPEGVTDDAEKRLRILEHFTELGSGYAIALKDLELRGAGNILGEDQSGFVHAVGLDTYTRLLEDTIRKLKSGESEQEPAATEVLLAGSAYLPDEYIADGAQKLHLYRRLSRLETVGQVQALAEEIRDRYGPPPEEVERLVAAARLRLAGTELGVERLHVQGDSARVTFRSGVIPRIAALQRAFHDNQVDVEVRRSMPLSIVLRRRGARSITDTLLTAFDALAADRAQAA